MNLLLTRVKSISKLTPPLYQLAFLIRLLLHLIKKLCFFIICIWVFGCEYSRHAVPVEARRGLKVLLDLELKWVESCHVDVGNWTLSSLITEQPVLSHFFSPCCSVSTEMNILGTSVVLLKTISTSVLEEVLVRLF